MRKIKLFCICFFTVFFTISAQSLSTIRRSFVTPPDAVKPGVYWYFMDGWMSKEAMTKDLESMKLVGIRDVIFLEIDQGVPTIPGKKIDFFSQQWQQLYRYMVHEAERLGINITMGVGPGWTGSGGPWVPMNESMRNLVYTTTEVNSNGVTQTIQLPKPSCGTPYFGEGVYTPHLKKQAQDYYEDVFVLAYPTAEGTDKIGDIANKALYKRDPYSSGKALSCYPLNTDFDKTNSSIAASKVIDLTAFLQPDNSIKWKVPAGKWTVLRMGMANNGAVTRPAPQAGLGFECDKMSKEAFKHHYDSFVGSLIKQSGVSKQQQGGLKTLHMDSWEMGAENWTPSFNVEFKRRRAYDPVPYLPCYTGQIVENKAISDRFLWDMRLTAQELVLENHAEYAKSIAHKEGLNLSIEPYDMTPLSDLDLGAVADIQMCEFWNKGLGFNAVYSCIEAASIAHILGKSEVRAESFTSNWGIEPFTSYPTSMKDQTDWAFAAGINKFFFHTFVHKPLGDDVRPGMTMAGYGVHWDRGQTWWSMVSSYHDYISRCSYILHQGRSVADILYLAQDAAPCVFKAPTSAMEGDPFIPDRKGYNFDACSPNMLIKLASVKNGKIVFPGGASYRILILPSSKTMRPELLKKIKTLVDAGATVVGNPPIMSPSLTNYPACDEEVKLLSSELWGKGKIVQVSPNDEDNGYANYNFVATLLQKRLAPDFTSNDSLRYTHRKTADGDIYFVSNKSAKKINASCAFRATAVYPELWDAQSGNKFALSSKSTQNGVTKLNLTFEPYQSYFVIFPKSVKPNGLSPISFKKETVIQEINSPWEVSFDPKWGGPASVTFDKLMDWTSSSDKGIKYYSGIATYRNTFVIGNGLDLKANEIRLCLGVVKNMARVRINGKEVGILWTAPWSLKINNYLKIGINKLEIEVANLWTNRLIGDEQKPDDGIKDGHIPSWLINKTARTSGRYTFTTFNFYKQDSPLQPSGLLGPIQIVKTE